jgi:hypothetical protein
MAIKVKGPKRSARSRRSARASKNPETIKALDRELLGIPRSEWAAAKRKERIVKKALRSDIEAAADFAGCSARTIRRLVANYRIDPSPLAFLPHRPGPKPGSQRLDLERESIVAEVVEHWKASPVSGRGTNVGAPVTYHLVVRKAASCETSDKLPERTPPVGSRALHSEPAAIDERPLPTNAWVGVYPSAD